jgi:hypothetical protein
MHGARELMHEREADAGADGLARVSSFSER